MTLRLPKTKVAMAKYDRLLAAYHSLNATSPLVGDRAEELWQAGEDVGEAFAQDTADRNSYENARLIQPGPWLRGLIEKYEP